MSQTKNFIKIKINIINTESDTFLKKMLENDIETQDMNLEELVLITKEDGSISEDILNNYFKNKTSGGAKKYRFRSTLKNRNFKSKNKSFKNYC